MTQLRAASQCRSPHHLFPHLSGLSSALALLWGGVKRAGHTLPPSLELSLFTSESREVCCLSQRGVFRNKESEVPVSFTAAVVTTGAPASLLGGPRGCSGS